MVEGGLLVAGRPSLNKLMKIVLFTNGVNRYSEDCEFVSSNVLREQMFLKNVIERIKLKNYLQIMKADYWEIFIQMKSKMK